MTESQLNDSSLASGEAFPSPPLNLEHGKPERKSSDKPWLFDAAKAKEMAKKSKEARQRREQEAKQALQMVNQLKACAIVEPSETYRLNRLARVRAQLAKVDSELDELLDDPKADQSRLKAILDASKALSEQERKLDNRPEPGSFRPSSHKSKPKAPDSYGPVE